MRSQRPFQFDVLRSFFPPLLDLLFRRRPCSERRRRFLGFLLPLDRMEKLPLTRTSTPGRAETPFIVRKRRSPICSLAPPREKGYLFEIILRLRHQVNIPRGNVRRANAFKGCSLCEVLTLVYATIQD